MSDPNEPNRDDEEETADKGGDSDPSANEGFAPPDDEDRDLTTPA